MSYGAVCRHGPKPGARSLRCAYYLPSGATSVPEANKSSAAGWGIVAVAVVALVGLAFVLFQRAKDGPTAGGSSAQALATAPDPDSVTDGLDGADVVMKPDVGAGDGAFDGGDTEPDEADEQPLQRRDVGTRSRVEVPEADEEAITMMQTAIKADATGTCDTADQAWESAVSLAQDGDATDRTKRMVVYNAAHRFVRCAKNDQPDAGGPRRARAQALFEALVDMGEGPFFADAEKQLASLGE